MYSITKEKLEQTLSKRINQSQAEIKALKDVEINTSHNQLTNRAVKGGVIGDYLSIGKALYVYYQFRTDGVSLRSEKTDISAYTYDKPDGTEIGSNGIMRISRTMTPTELKATLDNVIADREETLKLLKIDLVNADKIVSKYNKIVASTNDLFEGVTWATRSVLK